MKAIQTIWHLPRSLAKGVVYFYRGAIKPWLGGGSCRFTPTCSEYAVQALDQFGFVRGTILAVWRILRCNPWTKGHGHDPPSWFGSTMPLTEDNE